jgi:putative ABC transport system permease protein
MYSILAELKYCLRRFQQGPGFTISALSALAIGIGANTAIFSVINTVLLKPLAVPEPDRVVQFMLTTQGNSFPGGSPQHYFLWRNQTNLFRDVSGYRLELINLTGDGDPEQIAAARITADFFNLFGAPVLYGRRFTTEEDRPGSSHVLLLSYRLWRRRFGSDARVIGKTVLLSESPYEVIGVLAPTFNSEQFDQRPEVWLPFQMDPNSTEGGCYCRVAGRLMPGVTLAAVNAQLQLAADQYRREFPKLLGPKTTFTVQSLRDAMVGDVRSTLVILLCAVSFVLLIACTNVANLLLVRATGRRREIAIRVAVGAGRGRIVRQLLVESLMLSLAGGALGLVLGLSSIRALLTLYPSNPLLAPLNVVNIPRIGEQGSAVGLDWQVLVFTAVISTFTGVVFGLIPAVSGSRVDLNTALKGSSNRSATGFHQNRTRSLLVITEMALALVLLIGAALLIRTSLALRTVNPGFDLRNVLIMQMSLSGTRFEKTSEVGRIVGDGVDRLHVLPGVSAAASSCCVPLETVWYLTFVVAGRPLTGPYHGYAGWTFISPEFFDAFKIPVLHGRPFNAADDAGAPGVVIINQAMARRFWPNSDPLNDRLIIGRAIRPEYNQDPPRQIVGIVGDIRDAGLKSNPRPAMYVPIAQLPDSINALNLRLLPVAWIVRSYVDPLSLEPAIKDGLRQATGLPVTRVRSMDEVASQSTARTQLNMVLMTVFGFFALLLAAIGIYGLMAYSAQLRTQEIGIRLALGAEPKSVRMMLVNQGIRLAVIGAAIGLASAFGLTHLIASLLYGVKPRDPIVFLCVPVTLIVVAFLAVWFPARRAMRINPVEALRYE